MQLQIMNSWHGNVQELRDAVKGSKAIKHSARTRVFQES